jgi:hypothetical protein
MDEERNYEERSYLGWLIGIAVVIGAAAIGYNYWRHSQPVEAPPAPQAEAPAPAPAPATTAPQIQHPVPAAEEAAAPPLPSLESSDALLVDSLTRLLGKKSLGEFFHVDSIVRRIVATVDNLPRARVASKIMITKPVPGAFGVERTGDDTVISAGNAARYTPYVQLMESTNPKQAVALYVRLYPLFQRAYQDLGYPNGYFNDRLVEVIDHLLAAPDVEGPIKLMQPKVRYEFVDPALESLSAGQKVMVRIGPENEARVKAVLREVRKELTNQPPPKQ